MYLQNVMCEVKQLTDPLSAFVFFRLSMYRLGLLASTTGRSPSGFWSHVINSSGVPLSIILLICLTAFSTKKKEYYNFFKILVWARQLTLYILFPYHKQNDSANIFSITKSVLFIIPYTKNLLLLTRSAKLLATLTELWISRCSSDAFSGPSF